MAGNAAARFAVVTGASSGIGLELAREFVDNGFDVLICAENAEIETAAAALLPVSNPPGSPAGAGTPVVQSVRADLATFDGVEALVSAIGGRGVDALALNAGIGVGGPFVQTSLDDDLRLIAVNVTSVVHLAKRVLPAMVARGSGRVLITASVAATMPGPYYATYAASKAFLLSFAEAIRYELKDAGVTVTALMPGPTDTDFFDRADMNDTPVDSAKKDDPADVARDGYEALMSGAEKVVAGSRKNKAQTALGKMLPESVKSAVHAKMTKPDDE